MKRVSVRFTGTVCAPVRVVDVVWCALWCDSWALKSVERCCFRVSNRYTIAVSTADYSYWVDKNK